jgi:hypothetical protein
MKTKTAERFNDKRKRKSGDHFVVQQKLRHIKLLSLISINKNKNEISVPFI